MRALDVYGDTGGVSSDQPVFLRTNSRLETCRNAEEDREARRDRRGMRKQRTERGLLEEGRRRGERGTLGHE